MSQSISKSMGRFKDSPKNIHEAIERYGHDEDYAPTREPIPTEFHPGSIGKPMELTRRVENGEIMHHPGDEKVLAGNADQELLRHYVRDHAENLRDRNRVSSSDRSVERKVKKKK